jgi:type II secretory pathway pseudopilin PulG
MQNNMNKRSNLKANSKQDGLTLIELLVSVGLLVLIAGYFVMQRVESVKAQKAESIAQEVLTLAAITTSYYVNEKAWPDQDGDCAGLLTALQSVFPPGYAPFSGPTLASDCSASSTAATQGFGRVLRLTLTFPYVDREYASLVASLIPASNLVIPAPTAASPSPDVTVEHYLFPPRKHAMPPFRLENLDSSARLTVQKPCATNPQLLLIPQALCLTDPTGFGGYYFDLESETNGPNNGVWRYRLMVTPGGTRDFKPMTEVCDPSGMPNAVGVITYCG